MSTFSTSLYFNVYTYTLRFPATAYCSELHPNASFVEWSIPLFSNSSTISSASHLTAYMSVVLEWQWQLNYWHEEFNIFYQFSVWMACVVVTNHLLTILKYLESSEFRLLSIIQRKMFKAKSHPTYALNFYIY